MDVRLRALVGLIAAALALTTSASAVGASPRRPATDCLASLPSRQCIDEDGSCDLKVGPGCAMRSSLCFPRPSSGRSCADRAVERVRLQRPLPGGRRGEVAQAILDALVDLGGSRNERSVAFADEPTTTCVRFTVTVPRKGERTGVTVVATKALADGASDVDRARFVCLPPDPTIHRAPPLSSGCHWEMDREECETHAGVFDETAGISQGPHCFCRTDDVGEPCDRPRCQGACVADDLADTSGTCSEFRTFFSCLDVFFAPGQVGTLCLD